MNNKDTIPFQVQHLIDSMLNPKDNVYVRGNFRNRLDTIQAAINTAIKTYDAQLLQADQQKRKTRG